ncbi:MAG: pilin [bacterium]
MTYSKTRLFTLLLSLVGILFSASVVFAGSVTTITNIVVTGRTVEITGTAGDNLETLYYSKSKSFVGADSVVITPDAKGAFTVTIPFPADAAYDGTYYVNASTDSGTSLTTPQTFVIGSTTTTTTTTTTSTIVAAISSVNVIGRTVTIVGTSPDIESLSYSKSADYVNADEATVSPASDGSFTVTIPFPADVAFDGTYFVRMTTNHGASFTANQTFAIGSSTNTNTTTTTTIGAVTATARVVPQDTFVDLYFKLSGTYASTAILVKYGATRITLTKSVTGFSNGTEYYAGITGLTQRTPYYYQPFSTIDGKPLADPAQFITNANTTNSTLVSNVVTSLSIKNIKQNEVTVVGKVALASNEIQFLIDKTGNGSFDSRTTPQIQNDKTFSFTITGLKAGSTYHLVPIKPNDSKVRLWNVESFATLPVYASAYVSELKDTSATIFAQISDGSENPTAYYGKDAKSMTTPAALRAVSGEVGLYSAPISGLTENTGYYYQIKSGDGKNVYTTAYTFLTLAKSSSTPTTVPTITDTTGGATGSATSGYTGGALVTCGLKGPLTNGKNDATDTGSNGVQSCNFEEFLKLINRLISFLLYLVAPIIMVGVMLWAGVLILTSGGKAESIAKGKSMMIKAVMGLVIAMGGWLIVQFTLTHLGYNEFSPSNVSGFPRFY